MIMIQQKKMIRDQNKPDPTDVAELPEPIEEPPAEVLDNGYIDH